MKQLLLAAIAGGVLSACAYRDINPEGAIADERASNGYNELRDVDPGTAKLVLRSVGAAYPARFSLSTAPQSCQGFSSLGDVAYAGRGVVYPWIANAVQRTHRAEPYLVHEAKPGQVVQVRGDGSWAGGTGWDYRSGRCGPVVVRFTPQERRAYTVEFVWGDRATCELAIMDATDPNAPVLVPTQAIANCPASAR